MSSAERCYWKGALVALAATASLAPSLACNGTMHTGNNRGPASVDEPVDTRPPRPDWTPPFSAPLGLPGWKDSTDPICNKNQGAGPGAGSAMDLWADERGVFALLWEGCDTLNGGVCGKDGASIKFNSGSGWQLAYQVQPATFDYPFMSGGFPNGPVIISTRFSSQNVTAFIDDQGMSLQNQATGSVAVVNIDLAYFVGADSLRKYSEGAWSTVDPSPSFLSDVWADSQTVIAVGLNQTVLVKDGDSPATQIPGAPAGDYTAVWAFGADDVWVGTSGTDLLHYDGSKWTRHPTGSRDYNQGGIQQLWGEAGILYFTTSIEFGRWNGASVEFLLEPPAGIDAFTYVAQYAGQFGRFSARSVNDVFIPIRDSRYKDYACGSSFALWFDGSDFHQF